MIRYIIAVVICYVAMMGIYLYKVHEVYQDLQEAQGVASTLEPQLITEDSPLQTTKHIEALPFTSLKTKADDMRRRYNRTHHMCAAVRSHLLKLQQQGFVSINVAQSVEKNLAVHEKKNLILKQQFDNIITFAEKQYAEGVIRQHSEEAESQARLLDKQNEILLKNVDLPVSFQ